MNINYIDDSVYFHSGDHDSDLMDSANSTPERVMGEYLQLLVDTVDSLFDLATDWGMEPRHPSSKTALEKFQFAIAMVHRIELMNGVNMD